MSWFPLLKPPVLLYAIVALCMSCGNTNSEDIPPNTDASAQTGDTANTRNQDGASTNPPPSNQGSGHRSCGSETAPCISCSNNNDCFVNLSAIEQQQSWMQACGANDLCVECLGDDDDFSCGVNTYSLGPKCIDNLCGCDDTVTCSGNINGWKCLSAQGKSYCGCETDDDCGMTGYPCVDNPYVDGKTCQNAVWPD